MKKYVFVASALTSLLMAGEVFAQSTSSLNVNSTPVSGSVSPGTGQVLGTITLSSPGGTYTVNSVPSSLTLGGGALANNLSNCALYNPNAASSTIAVGPTATIVSGANSFSLNPALTITASTPTTLQIRCNVATSTASGSTFAFNTIASSTVGTAVSGPALAVQADFVKTIPAGLNNAIVGIITLDATQSSKPITVTSLPVSVTTSNGANYANLTNCVLTTTTGTVLTTGGNAVSAITGSNTLKLDAPLTVAAGQGALLVLRCNVSSSSTVGGTLTVGIVPSTVQATASSTPVTVTQGNLSSGTPGTNSASITISPLGTQPGSPGTPSTPGVPNTGAGGDAMAIWTILALSAILAAFAARIATRTR